MAENRAEKALESVRSATNDYIDLSQNAILRQVLDFFSRFPHKISIDGSVMGNPYHVFQYLSSKTTPERPRIICGMLFFMGLRLGELLLLEKKDLDLIGKTALIYTLKQRKAIKNAIPLDHVPASELKLWNAYMMTVAGERIFQDVSRRTVERIVVRELDMNPHALRHALGLFLYEYTKDIRVVSQVLRHKNISNTFIYTKLSLQGVREKIKI